MKTKTKLQQQSIGNGWAVSNKTIQCCVVVLFMNLVSVQLTMAGGFRDRFNNWLLDGTAQATVLPNDQQTMNRLPMDPISMDPISMDCLRCHNGSRAIHIQTKKADDPWQYSSSGIQINHPVGMYYDDYTKHRKSRLKPRSSLDSNIALINGMVTCVSCHRPMDTKGIAGFAETPQDEYLLVRIDADACNASQDRIVGCLACHDM